MNICLYGASSNDINNSYIEQTEILGERLAKRGHSLVFGGGNGGLMGAAARGAQRENGEIIGIAPRFFKPDGVLFENCTEFIFTETMRERKGIMEQKSDAFIMTPGGIGTFDEFFEILTLKQLGRHAKPIAIFNINGYFDELDKMLHKAIEKRFMSAESRRLWASFEDPDELLSYIENYKDNKRICK